VVLVLLAASSPAWGLQMASGASPAFLLDMQYIRTTVRDAVSPAFTLVTAEPYTADQNNDGVIGLTELLRVIQFFNIRGFHCVTPPATSEDGFLPGAGSDQTCAPHACDYTPQDWQISLTELLRLIQFFNIRAYHPCPSLGTEDGFCPGSA
jgi:hypothetical protein